MRRLPRGYICLARVFLYIRCSIYIPYDARNPVHTIMYIQLLYGPKSSIISSTCQYLQTLVVSFYHRVSFYQGYAQQHLGDCPGGLQATVGLSIPGSSPLPSPWCRLQPFLGGLLLYYFKSAKLFVNGFFTFPDMFSVHSFANNLKCFPLLRLYLSDHVLFMRMVVNNVCISFICN